MELPAIFVDGELVKVKQRGEIAVLKSVIVGDHFVVNETASSKNSSFAFQIFSFCFTIKLQQNLTLNASY